MVSVYTKITMRTGFEIQRLVFEAVLYIEYKEPPFQHNGEMALAGPKYSIPGSLGISALNEADIPTQELYDQFDNRDLRKKTNFKTEFAHLKNR